MGGSFDPAHEGHIYISNIAIKYLNLDQVWWLVTTQNPIKKKQFHTIEKRLDSTKIIKNYKIKPQALEFKLGTKYTYDTLKKLKKIMPSVNFYWIMGADNLIHMHSWYNWKKIFYLYPIIVFNRPKYFYKAIASKAAKCFWKYRVSIKSLNKNKNIPSWSFLNVRLNYSSSTYIRKNME